MGHVALSILVNLFWVTLCLSLFIHVIYPLFLAGMFRVARKGKKFQPQIAPPVSILLWDNDTNRAQKTLSTILESILPKSSEVFLLGAAARIKIESLPEFVKPIFETEKFDQFTALNLAATKAAREALVIIDPESTPDRYSIRALAEFIANSDFDCAFGFSSPRFGFINHSRWVTKLSEESFISNISVAPSILAIRKESYKPVSSNENLELAIAFDMIAQREKIGICSQADTKVSEPKNFLESMKALSQTMIAEAKTLFAQAQLLNPLRFGLVSIRLWLEKVFLWLSPFFMYTAFIANFILALLYSSPKYQIPMFLQSAFYFMALLGHSRWKLGKKDFIVKIFRFVQSSLAAALMWQNYSKR